MRRAIFAAVSIVIVAGVGCRTIQWPHLYSPGSADVQRQYASNLVDPFAAPEAGPNIDDTRPRDFNRPTSETKRTQSNPFVSIQRRPRFSDRYLPPTPADPPPAWGTPAMAPSPVGP